MGAVSPAERPVLRVPTRGQQGAELGGCSSGWPEPRLPPRGQSGNGSPRLPGEAALPGPNPVPGKQDSPGSAEHPAPCAGPRGGCYPALLVDVEVALLPQEELETPAPTVTHY